MKGILKKDIVNFCNKFDINHQAIEDNIVFDLQMATERLENKKANKELNTLMKKYGYTREEPIWEK